MYIAVVLLLYHEDRKLGTREHCEQGEKYVPVQI